MCEQSELMSIVNCQLYYYVFMKKGFTLVEFIIYIGITSAVLIAILAFVWAMLGNYQKQLVYQEIRQSGSFVLNIMSRQLEAATGVVEAESTFDAHPGVLKIATPSNDIIFDTLEKEVIIGEQAATIRVLRIKQGEDDPVVITSDRLDVKNLVFKNFTPIDGDKENIQINLTLESVNPSGSKQYAAEISWQLSVNLRL